MSINIVFQYLLVVGLLSLFMMGLRTIERANQMISQRNEVFRIAHRCGGTKAALKNIEDAAVYLATIQPERAQRFHQVAAELLAELESGFSHLTPDCGKSDLLPILYHQDPKNPLPNWHYQLRKSVS